jgi:hypothetical protein
MQNDAGCAIGFTKDLHIERIHVADPTSQRLHDRFLGRPSGGKPFD